MMGYILTCLSNYTESGSIVERLLFKSEGGRLSGDQLNSAEPDTGSLLNKVRMRGADGRPIYEL